MTYYVSVDYLGNPHDRLSRDEAEKEFQQQVKKHPQSMVRIYKAEGLPLPVKSYFYSDEQKKYIITERD